MMTKARKRLIKSLAKKYLEKKPAYEPIPGVLIHREDGDYDREKHVFLVDAPTEAAALEVLEERFPVYGIRNTPSAYDCTGRPFCNPAKVRQVTKDRYLVHLQINYDV